MAFVSRRKTFAAITFAVSAYAIFAASACREPPSFREYRLPLFGPYSIYRTDLHMRSNGNDTHYLSRQNQSLDGQPHGSFIVSGLKQYAVYNHMIVGTTERRFFIFDGSDPDSFAEPTKYRDLPDWQAALQDAGIPMDIALKDPDTEAARLPDRVIRPFDYTILNGLLGRSDLTWAFVVQCNAFCLCFIIGVFAPITVSLLLPSILIGLTANFIGEVALAGHLEPAAFAGCIGLPLLCLAAAHLGRLPIRIWNICIKWHHRRVETGSLKRAGSL